MKICKSCGLKNSDIVKVCHGCSQILNDGNFINEYELRDSSTGDASKYTLHQDDRVKGWSLEGRGITVHFIGLGVIKPDPSRVIMAEKIIDGLDNVVRKIESGINNVISEGHKIDAFHIEFFCDKEPYFYEISFDVSGSMESQSNYPFMEMVAHVDLFDHVKIKIHWV